MTFKQIISITLQILIVLATLFAGLVTGVAANLLINLVAAKIPQNREWMVIAFTFLLLAVVIALLAVLVEKILENLRSAPATVERWTSVFILFGSGLFLALIMIRFGQFTLDQASSWRTLFFVIFALLPLFASILGAKYISTAAASTLELNYAQIDELVKQSPRVEERAILAKLYPKRRRPLPPEVHETTRALMIDYVAGAHFRDEIPRGETVTVDSTTDAHNWALARGKPASSDEGNLTGGSRENQQWILLGKWLSTQSDEFFLLLLGMAQEPAGLSISLWQVLALLLEDLQRRKMEMFKLGQEDEIFGRAKGKYDLTSDEHHLLKRLEEILQGHPDARMRKGILGSKREMESSQPFAWRLLAMLVDDLEAKEKKNELTSEDRELMIRLQEVLSHHSQAKAFSDRKKAKEDFEKEQRLEREKLLLRHWLENHEGNAYAELLTMAKSPLGLSPESWEKISNRRVELSRKISDSGKATGDDRVLVIRMDDILYFKDHPERGK